MSTTGKLLRLSRTIILTFLMVLMSYGIIQLYIPFNSIGGEIGVTMILALLAIWSFNEDIKNINK